jgi:antitoxin component YwqK of YwqJK toxin-antitoxin module
MKNNDITTLYYKNGNIKYIGEVNEKGQPHGKGKGYYEDGTLDYEGEFEDGEPTYNN